MKKILKAINVIINGRVTGVGFRYFIKANAKSLNVRGWVRNNSANEVEALLIAEIDAIKKMLDICREGPPLSTVERVDKKEIKDINIDDYTLFEITS